MRFLYLDFETYYADDYTLSKSTAEEYVRDPRFEIIGVAFGYAGEQPVWHTGDLAYIKSVLQPLPWHDIFVVGHNMSAFDSLILTEVCGVRPARYGCTLQLARRLHGAKTPDGKSISNALGALARMYNLPMDKGDEVVHAKNKRRLDFSPSDLAAYGQYCIKDTLLCGMLWQKLMPKFPKSEILLAHLTTKMWAEPRLTLDMALLSAMRDELALRKAETLDKVADILGVGASMTKAERAYHTAKLLGSNEKFAELLRLYGVEPPMKPSPKQKNPDGTAKLVYAFAKTDDSMQEMLEYEDSEDEDVNLAVQAIVSARLGTKSTIVESRVDRFYGIGTRGDLPVPYAWGKTLTDRLSGSMSINMQNMNRLMPVTPKTPNGALIMTPGGWTTLMKRKISTGRDGKPFVSDILDASGAVWKGKDCHVVGLRDAVLAKPGYKLVAADSSNVELRTCHMMCGQEDSIAILRAGGDLYCDFGTSFYGRTITKEDHAERQHGKVAELQLQFQAAAGSFRKAARIMAGVRLTELEAQTTVDIYRAKRAAIKGMWYTAQKAIPAMASGGGFYLDPGKLLYVERNAIRRPNGMRLEYHNLRQEELVGFDGLPEVCWVYDDREDRKMKKLYGGKVIQGCTQALARDIVFEQKLAIEKELGSYERHGEGVVMSTHDEPVCSIREDRAEDALQFMLEVMHRSPTWWPDIPLKAEGAIGNRYSDCK